MKKKIYTILVIIVLLVLSAVILTFSKYNNRQTLQVGETISNPRNQITINIYNKENEGIYGKILETDKEYLIDVLKDMDDIDIIFENGQYGAYITSILGIEQKDDYYWSYYIDDGYADTGVSNCKIENNKKYSFKIEKFNY